ncbi:MAG: universal stress protein [Cyclobacteriaceae bacterium]
MKRIILPTDFSKQATYALDLACDFAKKGNASITLIHVIEHSKKSVTFLGSSSLNTMASWSTGVEMDDIYFVELYRKRREQMAEVMADPKYVGLNIQDKIMMGSPYHAISEEIAEQNADFIIMGTTGVNDWAESLIGSVAEKVVRNAKCPVLTLRNSVRFEDINNIAFASDFKEKLFPYASIPKSIQEFFDAKLHLVYVNTPGSFKNERTIKTRLGDFANENGFKNFEIHLYSHEHEEEGIVCFSEDYKMDMVMMATEGRSGFSRLFEPSIAEDVVNYSKKPVVTFNMHKLESVPKA